MFVVSSFADLKNEAQGRGEVFKGGDGQISAQWHENLVMFAEQNRTINFCGKYNKSMTYQVIHTIRRSQYIDPSRAKAAVSDAGLVSE